MSRRAVYLLQKVESEYNAALSAIAFTGRFWHYQDRLSADTEALPHLTKMTLQQFKSALPEETVKDIFIIRLFAVFEGI